MSGPDAVPEGETGFDRVVAFTVPGRNVRGRTVRLGPVLDTVLAAHSYPRPVARLLAEALVITALMGSLLKEGGSQLTLQVQAEDGIVDLLVCDYTGGELRGYVRHDPDRLGKLGLHPTLEDMFGAGYLVITFDLSTTGERYQGIVPLTGASLAGVCENYFVQSEQVPTLLRVAVELNSDHCVAGGILLQHLPHSEEGRERIHAQLDHPEWEHAAIMGGSVRDGELVDPALSQEALIWRLFHEEPEVRVDAAAGLSRGCRCSPEYYSSVLKRFDEVERAEMRDQDGLVGIDCAFCSKTFRIAV